MQRSLVVDKQRSTIVRFLPGSISTTPEEVVRYAREYNAPVIAYTYSEPTAFYEYMLDTARLAREEGLLNVVISPGLSTQSRCGSFARW